MKRRKHSALQPCPGIISRHDKLLLHMRQEFALELASSERRTPVRRDSRLTVRQRRAELEFGAPVHGKNPG